MAISYVGGQVSGRGNAQSALSVNFALTGGSASVPAAGDLVIVTAVTGTAATNPAMAITTPTGYTALGQLNQSAATADTAMNVSYKLMTSTPDTAVTIPGAGDQASGQAYTIQVFRGVNSATPIDVTPVSAGGTGTGRPDPGSITPFTAGAWVVICGGGAAATAAAYVAPANFTTNFLTTALGADTTDAMVGSGYWTGWTSGAVNPAAYTGGTTAATDSWACYTIAISPYIPPATTLYFYIDSPPETVMPWNGVTRHPSLPSAKNYPGVNSQFNRSLKLSSGTPTYQWTSPIQGDTTNITQPMSFYFGLAITDALAAQTIPVQTWNLAQETGQTAAFGETYFRPCIYIWRPSTQSVVGYIADGSNNLGYNATYWSEWPNAITPNSTTLWILPPTGAPGGYVPQAITTQNGDVLVIEMWGWVRIGQASTGDASRTIYLNSATTRLELSTTVLTYYTPSPGLTDVPTLFMSQYLPQPEVIVGLKISTDLYFLSSTAPFSPSAVTKSWYLPLSTNSNWVGGPAESMLGLVAPGGNNLDARTVGSVSNNAVVQSYYLGRYSTLPLLAQVIPAQSWNYSPVVGEGNALANTFFWLVMYIWRPSNGSIPGFIFNSNGAPGVEWPVSPTVANENFIGASVTTQIGDILVVEAWGAGQLTTAGVYTQTWQSNAPTSKISSTYQLSFPTSTYLYLSNTVATIAPTAGDKATNLPLAVNTNWSGIATEYTLTETQVQAPVGRSLNAVNNTVATQSYYFGRHSTKQLAAQVIPSQTWSWELSCGEANANANTYHWPVLYVWRPSNSTVVGYILDTNNQGGNEWLIWADPQFNQLFVGNSVTVQDGDILVAEIWGAGQQSVGGTYAQDVWVLAANSRIGSPYALQYYVAPVGTVIDVPVLVQIQDEKLPAVNGLGSPTSLFPVDDASNISPTGATRASNLPKSVTTSATNSNIEGVLSSFWGGVGNVINRTLNAKSDLVNAQSYYFGRFTTRPLQAQTIPSQLWNYNFQVNEASANSNTFFWPVLYRWRPSDNTVDYIFNASADGGTEWGITTAATTQNFSGLQITIQDGDVLVLEAWASGKQTTTGGTYLQTWVITSNVSGLISPYKLAYLPNSILYFNANVPAIAPTAGDKATNLPKAQNTNWSGSATESSMSETLVQAPVGRNLNTIASTAQQSYYFGRHSSLPLAAQTIPAQLWGWEVSCGEINALANIFHWPVLYIWRPGTSSVVGYILDASADYGIEWRVSTDPLLSQQFSGASVTTQDGDILVAEIWGVATQGAATSYTAVNVWTTAVNASLVSPFKLTYSTGKRRIAVIS